MTQVEQILILDQTLRLLAFWHEEIGDSPDEPPEPGEDRDREQDQLSATLDWQYRLFDERRQELLWSLSEEELHQYNQLAQKS